MDIWDPGQDDPGPCGGGVLAKGLVALGKYVDGFGTEVKHRCSSNSVTGTNALRVVANGPKITVYVNSSKMLSYTDPTPITYGGVGVGQIWETDGWFDNAVVRTVS